MPISRRDFFRHASIGAAASATTWRLDESSQALPQGRSGSTRPADPIRLDMNINPYGPSPRVVEMIRTNLEQVNRYPDSAYRHLAERIADFHRVKSNQITLGAGSREVLRMAVAAFLTAGKRLVLASPTFEPVGSLAKQVGAEVTAVPINKYYAHDLDAMLHRTNASTGLLYICNPNNPTGSLTPRKDLEAFLEKLPSTVAVVIDEAYHEYVGSHSDYASFIDHPIDHKRVLVMRTFSKIHGLAGLRLGYAVSSEDVSLKLSSLRLEKGINIVAAGAAVAALDDSEYVRLSSGRNADQRQEFYNQTNARMLRQIDSHTNFVFLKSGLPSSQVIQHFERNNIILGPVVPQLENYVRVAISTQASMQEFWRVWELMPSMSHQMAANQIE
jgi:histidinol-phosphate aminotransferase